MDYFIKIDPYYLDLGYRENHAKLLTYLNNWQSWWHKQNPTKTFEGIQLSIDKIAKDLNRSNATIYRWLEALNGTAIDTIEKIEWLTGGFYKKVVKYALNPCVAKVSHYAKSNSHNEKDVSHNENPTIYKTNHLNQPSKHTEEVTEMEKIEPIEPVADTGTNLDISAYRSDPDLTPPLVESPPSAIESLDPVEISGMQESSAADYKKDTASNTEIVPLRESEVALFDRHWNTETLSMVDLADLTNWLIEGYNNFKPGSWQACSIVATAYRRDPIRSAVLATIERYRHNADSMSDAISDLKADWQAAILLLGVDKWLNGEKFNSKKITYLLAAPIADRDRLARMAQEWRDTKISEKQGLARRMVDAVVDGIPEWGNPTNLITGLRKHFYIKNMRYLASLPKDDPRSADAPDAEYVAKYLS